MGKVAVATEAAKQGAGRKGAESKRPRGSRSIGRNNALSRLAFSRKWLEDNDKEKKPFNEELFSNIFGKENIEKLVAVVKKATETEVNESRRLLSDDYIYSVQITSQRAPHVPVHLSRILLPHSIETDDSDICLFVRDLKRGRKLDFEPTIKFYEQLLRSKKVTRTITIIPVNQLYNEYATFELRRKLTYLYDKFLVDKAVATHVDGFLGHKLLMKGRSAIPIDLDAEDIAEEIDTNLRKVFYKHINNGIVQMVQIGRHSMSNEAIAENIIELFKQLGTLHPGGSNNIYKLHLKPNVNISVAVPIYINTEHSLRGIFIKVCMFLKSPLKSVRLFTRNILKDIMQTVGTKYLGQLMNQMTSMLTRGFQVHVLTVTMYGILEVLKTSFKLGEIDAVLQNILSVCLEDIFGKTSDEKEVKKIAGHTPEAKPSNCSFQSLNIVAINISESCMLDLLMPLKTYLLKSQSKKVVTKVQNCCQTISLESLLMFIYGTSSESIPDLLPGAIQPVLTKTEREKINRIRPDCFLIAEQPRGRSGAITKVAVTNVRANAHVLIEFGLSMLQIILKRGKLLKINYEPFINPIIPVLLDSLNSSHILVTIYSLKCLSEMWNKSMDSQKLIELTPSIVQVIFKILHKYATPGMSTVNENFRLVKNAFGTMVSVIRHNKHFTITEDQLITLLMYVDQNLGDSSNQIFAFDMLKVILGRQLVVSQIHDIMRKISEMAITSESGSTRSEAKMLLVNYLMNYPLGKKINGYFNFLVTNLNYETVSGREAAIQILTKIINRFPQEILHRKADFLFVWLGTRLVNDESADCRKCAAVCVESLISKCDETHQNQLFDVVLETLQETKTTHIEMGAMLCSRFVAVEKSKFVNRMDQVLPLLIATLPLSKHNGPGKFVRLTAVCSDDSDDDETDENRAETVRMQKERARDHQLIQVTNTILKIFECHPNKMSGFNQYIDQLAYESQILLAYDHVWVRVNAAKILGLILSRINVEQMKLILSSYQSDDDDSNEVDFNFLYKNPASELKSLCLDLCAQLVPDATDEEMANQVVNNLLYVANMIKDISLEKQTKTEHRIINLHWLIRRMRYVVHAEVATTPHITTLRTAVFHWIQGLIELLPEQTLNILSNNLMAPLVREMSEEDKNIDATVRQLALKVGNSLKQRIGDVEYQLLKTRLLTKLVMKRAERKKIVAQTKVDDPVRASLRKMGERTRKKEAKKRKMDVLKGRALPKKKKRKLAIDDDLF